jgi:acetyltransferase-like isoleucine patch superfamily enzyme
MNYCHFAIILKVIARFIKLIYCRVNHGIALSRGWVLITICKLKYGNRVEIGSNFKVFGPGAIIKVGFGGSGKLQIGNNCTLVNATKYNPIGVLKPCSIIVGSGWISIGNNVGMSGASLFSDKSILIGDYVTIGANCFIFDTDFHSLNSGERINDHSRGFSVGVNSAPVEIGRNAFIGLNSIITKNAKIGENAIVAAGVSGPVKCAKDAIIVTAKNLVL